tara:strand:- start:105 stop:623 length:519 start_codon:yes stop_codon:yes gene_type:complete
MNSSDSYFDTKNITRDNRIDNGLLDTNEVPVDKDGNYYDASTNFVDMTDPDGISEAETELKKDFDLGKFNIVYDNNKKIVKEHQRLKDLEKLNELSQKKKHISLYDQNIYQILVNTKDTWFNLLDDLLDRQYQPSTFYKDNRLFYIGITIMFFSIVLYLYAVIVDDNKCVCK